REEFIRLVTSHQPEAPPYFTYDAILNTKERPTLEKTLEQGLNPLTLEEVLRFKNTGAQLLDARDPADHAGAHLVDSINIGLGGKAQLGKPQHSFELSEGATPRAASPQEAGSPLRWRLPLIDRRQSA